MYYVSSSIGALTGTLVSELHVTPSNVLLCNAEGSSAVEMSKEQAEALADYLNTLGHLRYYAVSEEDLEDEENG